MTQTSSQTSSLTLSQHHHLYHPLYAANAYTISLLKPTFSVRISSKRPQSG